jgi:putative spermidine/putrescine transport system ATP-binding protein
MSSLTLNGLAKEFQGAAVVEDVSIHVENGELVALLGPSGCGKTTTLRMVAGFVPPSGGTIFFGNRNVTAQPPNRRNTAMVFQSYALFPHMSVAENIAFGLKVRKVAKAERDSRVIEALRAMQLTPYAERLPRQLSGGQQQRVAIARAIVVNPDVFLLDEPLSNLDAKLRADVRLEIKALQKRLGLTTLLVTHDQEEALVMADRLVVMSNGRVRQIGTAKDLYNKPADAFVASFVGRCNLISGELAGPGCFRSNSGIALPCEGKESRTGAVLAIRPENVALTTDPSRGLPVRVHAVGYLGASTEYHLDLGGEKLVAVQPTPRSDSWLHRIAVGDSIFAQWDDEAARLLTAEIS